MLRHWIFTLLCGPIMFAIINGFTSNWTTNNLYGFLQVYPFMILIGLLFSVPTYVFYSILFAVFKNKKIQPIYAKMTLIVIVTIGVFITTALINGTVWFDFALSYSISSIIVGLSLSSKYEEENA